jgi:hypothetical protein
VPAPGDRDHDHGLGTLDEDPVVRQYRFLLRHAPADALEAAHDEALRALPPLLRAGLLRSVQERLVAGLRLGPGDVGALAHLMTLGERRTPGCVLAGIAPGPLRVLAEAVIDTEAAFGLFSGYAVWDGAEPEAPLLRGDMAGWDEAWHQRLGSPVLDHGLVRPVTVDSRRHGL